MEHLNTCKSYMHIFVLQRIKDFELNAQSEIDMLERQLEELEQQAPYNSSDVKSEWPRYWKTQYSVFKFNEG